MSAICVILMDEALSAADAVEVYIETAAAMREDQSDQWQEPDSEGSPVAHLILQAPNAVLREIATEGLFNDDYVQVQHLRVGCVLLGPSVSPGPRLEALIAEKAHGAP